MRFRFVLKQALGALAASISLLASASGAAAAETPPLRVIVPFASGGPTDKIALAFADTARRYWKGPITVENVGGEGGSVGAAKVAKAPADGATILLHNIALSAAPAIYRDRLTYSPLEDFEYLGLLAEVPMTLVGRTELPKSLAGLTQWLRSRAAPTLAHAGVGSASHLCGLLIQDALKISLHERSYQGNGPAMVDVVAGRVDLLCDVTTSASPQIAAGRIQAYGVTSPYRVDTAELRSVPPLGGATITVWFGLSSPKGIPPDVAASLNTLVRAVAADRDFIAKQKAEGAVVVGDARLFPTLHKRFVAAQIDYWSTLLQSMNSKKAAGPAAMPRVAL